MFFVGVACLGDFSRAGSPIFVLGLWILSRTGIGSEATSSERGDLDQKMQASETIVGQPN